MRPLWLLCFALVAATPFVPALPARYVGALAGLALSYVLVLATGAPRDDGTPRQRAGRVLVGLGLFTAAFLVTDGLARVAGRGPVPSLLATAVVTTATLAGTVATSRRLGLYEPAP